MRKRKNEDLTLDDELPDRRSRSGGVPWGCIGTVIAALIAFLGTVLVKTPDARGVERPVIIVLVDTIFNNPNSRPATVAPTVIAVGSTLSATTDTIWTVTPPQQPTEPPKGTQLSDSFRTQVVEELTRTAQVSPPTLLPTFTATASPTISPTSITIPSLTPTPTFTAMPPTAGYTDTPAPQPLVLSVTTLPIPGASSKGVTFKAKTSGTYSFSISGGAYNTYPGGAGVWRTIIYIYKNRPIAWGEERGPWREPNSPDFSIGLWEVRNQSQSDAEQAGVQSPSVDIFLQEGDTLIFVPIDEQSAYVGNRGQVTVSVKMP